MRLLTFNTTSLSTLTYRTHPFSRAKIFLFFHIGFFITY